MTKMITQKEVNRFIRNVNKASIESPIKHSDSIGTAIYFKPPMGKKMRQFRFKSANPAIKSGCYTITGLRKKLNSIIAK